MTGLEHNPFLSLLGTYIVSQNTGSITLGMALCPMHLNRQGVLQGGVISALLDAAGGYAGLAQDPSDKRGMGLTISLAINFIAAIKSGIVLAKGNVVGGGKTIYYATSTLETTEGLLIATAQGSFKYGTAKSTKAVRS